MWVCCSVSPALTGTPGYQARRTAVMMRWCDAAQIQLSAVGLLNGKALSTNKLLNRLLGMHVELQGQIFGYFSTILDKVRTWPDVGVLHRL